MPVSFSSETENETEMKINLLLKNLNLRNGRIIETNALRRNRKHILLVTTFVILLAIGFGLFFSLKRQIKVKYSPNFTKYTVDQGGILQILCKADTWFLPPLVRWQNSTDLEVPMVVAGNVTSLSHYQIVLSRKNKALLVLTNVQQSATYKCINDLTTVTQITVEVRTLPKKSSESGNLTCLQGTQVLAANNPRPNYLINSLCNPISNGRENIPYMCHLLHYCNEHGNSYSHVVEASCVPADQCSSSLLCSTTNFPGVTQESCQATCCSTNNCSNYFVDADDYSSCKAVGDPLYTFLLVLWSLLVVVKIVIFVYYFCVLARKLILKYTLRKS